MSGPIHVVAIGARTPLGLAAEPSAAAIRARISRLRTHPILVDFAAGPVIGAYDSQLDPEVLGWPRIAALARFALGEVVERLSALEMPPGTIHLFLAPPEFRPGFAEADSTALVADIQASLSAALPGQVVKAQHTERGHAAGLHALHIAAEQLRRNAADVCIIGGADSYFHPETIGWLQEGNLLARSQGGRNGFSPGEGAGFVALAGESLRRRWRLGSYGTLSGAASAYEKGGAAFHEGCLGKALTSAVAGATATMTPPQGVVTDIFCDINGERQRTEEWGFAVLRSSQKLVDGSRYNAPAGFWGDQGAATGPLLTVLAVQAWRRGYARGPHALLWAASRGGLRSAIVLTSPERSAHHVERRS